MFELCLLGVGGESSLHPDYLESRLTLQQRIDWLAFYSLRPFGTKRDDLRQAVATYWQVSSQLAEIPDDHSPEKFQLKFDDDAPKNEAQLILERIQNRMAGRL